MLDKKTGSTKRGTNEIAANSPARNVDCVWSNTTKESTKFIATDPMLEMIVPSVMIVKFFVQSVCFCMVMVPLFVLVFTPTA